MTELVRITSDTSASEKKVPLFELDGKVYESKTSAPFGVGLRIQKLAEAGRNIEATETMMRYMVGDDGYEALLNSDEVTNEHVEAIVKALTELMAGNAEKA